MTAFQFPAHLTLSNVMTIKREATIFILKSALSNIQFDCGQIEYIDSAGVALLLFLIHLAKSKQLIPQLIHVNQGVMKLADFYGVSSFLVVPLK